MRYSSTLAAIALMLLSLGAAPATAPAPDLLLNGGAEQGKDEQPSIWFAASVPAEGLTMGRDVKTAHGGNASLFIDNQHKYDRPTANNWGQSLQSVPAEQTVTVRGWIKTADAAAANICLQCWDAAGDIMLAFASTPVVRGDQDWMELKSDPVVVPPETRSIIVRAALAGTGRVWFDDIVVTITSGAAPSAPSAASPTAPTMQVTDELTAAVGGPIERLIPIERDQMVLAYLPDWTHGRVDNIAVADNQGGVRTLLAWPADIGGEVDGRKFVLALYSRKTTITGEGGKIEVIAAAQPWDEKTGWKSQPQVSADDTALQFPLVAGEGWKMFDVTPIVQRQAQDSKQFQGVALRFTAEDKPSGGWSGYEFVSREGAGEWQNRRPVLAVVKSQK